jgi:hypothetical protein
VGYWQFGRKESEARYNELETKTAEALVKELNQALRSRKDRRVPPKWLQERVRARHEVDVTDSHIIRCRLKVLRSLDEVLESESFTVRRGSVGGLILHGESLAQSGVSTIRTRKS